MKRRTIITLGCAIVLFLVTMIVTWRMLTAVPVVSRPIVIEQAYAVSDGGSLGLEMRDANGLRLMVGLKGSLDRAPKDFPLFIVRWYGAVPLWRQLTRGSNDENEVVKLLRSAAADMPEKAKFIRSFMSILEERNGK